VDGKGKTQAKAVAQVAKDWGIVDQVAFKVYDTTASNTG